MNADDGRCDSAVFDPDKRGVSRAPAIPTFVISLARAAERRERILAHLQSLKIRHELVDAIDGKALPEAERNAMLAPGTVIHSGAVGCYLSHLKVYRLMVERSIPVALVLEDDARLSASVAGLLEKGCESMNWDYCFLDSDDHNERGPVFFDALDAAPLVHGLNAHLLSAGPHTLHAYLIRLDAARRRLECAFPIVKPIDLYDHLPYPIVFRAIVAPKLAWVSEDSLTSFTSKKSVSADSLALRLLRRSSHFYRLRDLLRLKDFRRRMSISRLVRAGDLPPGRKWVPLPSGREVIVSGVRQSG